MVSGGLKCLDCLNQTTQTIQTISDTFRLDVTLLMKHGDIQMDNARLDSVLVKYMRGEQDALTIDDMDVCCEIHLRHRKGWQKKEDKSFREIDLRDKHWNFDSATLLYPNLTAANHYQIFP